MNASILNLTNRVLLRINEVELTVDNFNSSRGVHSVAKQAVLDTIQRINKEFYQWPFDAAQHTELLVPGQSEYSWPVNFRTADWDSFQINKNETFNTNNHQLLRIEREIFYKYSRDSDDDNNVVGIGIPSYVFEAHGLGFGVTPVPDKAYEITFRYWKHPIAPVEPLEASNIPENFEHVIIDGAMVHVKMFKEDAEGAQLYDQLYKEGIKQMRLIYGRNWESVSDTRVHRRRNDWGFY